MFNSRYIFVQAFCPWNIISLVLSVILQLLVFLALFSGEPSKAVLLKSESSKLAPYICMYNEHILYMLPGGYGHVWFSFSWKSCLGDRVSMDRRRLCRKERVGSHHQRIQKTYSLESLAACLASFGENEQGLVGVGGFKARQPVRARRKWRKRKRTACCGWWDWGCCSFPESWHEDELAG